MALAASPIAAVAASPAPGSPLDSSDELVVSDSSTMTVGRYSMARDAAGDFVLVWDETATSSPYAESIHVQRFDAAGVPQGSEFQVDTSDIDPANPSVAMDAAGDFVAAWVSVGAPHQQAATYDVHAQRYDATGTALGGELLVSTAANFDDINPSVAMDAAGDFVVVWQGEPSPGGVPEPNDAYQIYARRYGATGTALGDPFLVSAAPGTNQSLPNAAMDAAGDFVAAWQTGDQQNMGYLAHNILAQRFDAAGLAQGGTFSLSTAPNTGRNYPHVAMAAAGGFVVAWINYAASAQSAQGEVTGDVHAQRYDAAGNLQGGELAINSFTAGDQSAPSVAMDAAGDFAVVWQSDNQVAADSGYDIYAQRYSPTGAPVGAAFLVNTSTEGSQSVPIAAMDADGDVVAAWGAYLSSTPHNHVYVRRFAGEESVDLSLGSAFAPATPSPGSNFSMTLATNNISATTPTGSNSVDGALGLGLGITATVSLPAGVIYRSAHGTHWTCADPVDATVACSYDAPLGAGSAASPLTVMLTAPSAPRRLDFSASVTSTLKPDASNSVHTSIEMGTTDSGGGGSSGDGGGSLGGGGTPSGAGGPQAASSGSGALDILSLVLLGLPLLGRRRSKK